MGMLFLLAVGAISATWALAPTLSSTDLCVSGQTASVHSAPPGTTIAQAGPPRGLCQPRARSLGAPRPLPFFCVSGLGFSGSQLFKHTHSGVCLCVICVCMQETT